MQCRVPTSSCRVALHSSSKWTGVQYLKVLLAQAVAGHVAAQQAARALLRGQHHRAAAVPKQDACPCGCSKNSPPSPSRPQEGPFSQTLSHVAAAMKETWLAPCDSACMARSRRHKQHSRHKGIGSTCMHHGSRKRPPLDPRHMHELYRPEEAPSAGAAHPGCIMQACAKRGN